WWAFTFPLAAVTLSSILMYELTKKDFYMFLSYTLAMITTLIVILVAVATIKHMAKKEICIME
ncbi:C4-dicarboxylate ABC transporter, partial [Aliarcobacter cryaerophilus]